MDGLKNVLYINIVKYCSEINIKKENKKILMHVRIWISFKCIKTQQAT